MLYKTYILCLTIPKLLRCFDLIELITYVDKNELCINVHDLCKIQRDIVYCSLYKIFI